MISDADLDKLRRNIDHLDPGQKARVLELLEERDKSRRYQEARDHFLPFVKLMWPDFIPGAHHTFMAEAFEKIASGELKRLIINMPPRFTKSELSSWLLPAWLIGKNPKSKVIQASNTENLASGFGRKVRNLISGEGGDTTKAENPYQLVFPGVHLAKDSQAAAGWHTNYGGEYFAIGVNGKVTGKGANCAYFACKCLTKRGILPMSKIRVGDEVWAYDHKTGQTCWTVVRAVSTKLTTDSLVDAGDLVCTADHRVYTARGYRPARETFADRDAYVLSLRESLRTLEERTRASASSARETERGSDVLFQRVLPREEPRGYVRLRPGKGTSSKDLQGMLPGRAQRQAVVHDVRQGVHAPELRGAEGPGTPRHRERFLLARLLRGASIYARAAFSSTDRRMQDLREAGVRCAEVLLNSVLRGEESQGRRVFGGVVGQSQESERPRRERMRLLRAGSEAHTSPPHRPQREKPRAVELDTAVRPVPQPLSSSSIGICAEDFAGLLQGEGEWVVDIQTDTENFFCEGVLVHNCAIIDDAHSEQEAKQAEHSPEIFDTVWEWYSSGIRQRLQPGGAIVIPMTRWSKRDLSGRLIKQMQEATGLADKWEVLSFPAILDEGLPTERSMWPGFWPLAELQKTRAALPLSKWQAQYIQEPTSQVAAIFKRDSWRMWGEDTIEDQKMGKSSCPAPQHREAWNNLDPPACKFTLHSWDAAATKNNRSHPSAFTSWGVFEVEDPATGKTIDNLILLSAMDRRMEFPELKKTAKEFYDEDQPDEVLIENKSAGMQLIQEFRSSGLPVQDFSGSSRGTKAAPNDKIARANLVSDIFASGYVWAPNRRWAEKVIEQMADFPNGEADDYVDSSVQAMIRFRAGGLIRTANDEPEDDDIPRPRRKRYY